MSDFGYYLSGFICGTIAQVLYFRSRQSSHDKSADVIAKKVVDEMERRQHDQDSQKKE